MVFGAGSWDHRKSRGGAGHHLQRAAFRFLKAIQGFGFIDEHDGNIIPDFVQKFALIADEPIFIGIQPELTLAFGASQDIEQFLTQRHIGSFFRIAFLHPP
jgi:hypothetical protein